MNTNPPRTDILGVGVSAINMSDAIATIEEWIKERTQHYVCVAGAHGVMECARDQRLREIHNHAGLVTPDGMPLVWMSWLCGARSVERVYGPDLMRNVTDRSPSRGYRHFYYGGAPGLATRLAAILSTAHPGLKIVGTYCPPFRDLTPEEDKKVISLINAANPDIVWVGLSTPKQEYWMANHIGAINAPVLIGVGAAFDFLAGTKKQAPTWMQRAGLEWLFRLATEPRRLWRRYAYVVPRFMVLASRQLARRRFSVWDGMSSRAAARK